MIVSNVIGPSYINDNRQQVELVERYIYLYAHDLDGYTNYAYRAKISVCTSPSIETEFPLKCC